MSCVFGDSSVLFGSIKIILVPFLAAFFINVAPTGWFTVGFEPIMITTSALLTSETGLETAPEPKHSNKATTDEA